jgi:hypothetical protein
MLFGTIMLYFYALANMGLSVGGGANVQSSGQGQTVMQNDGHHPPEGGSTPREGSVVWGT